MKKSFPWWYVYRGVNSTKKEVYHGVSKNAASRIGSSHCEGKTKAIAHWNCASDKIKWEGLSKHKTQQKASEVSHKLERILLRQGYKTLRTGGI